MTGYRQLSTERLINLAIDFVKVSQPLPEELKTIITELGLLQVLYPKGVTDEATD